MLNWGLIKKMSATGLVDFYSHTKSHKKCSLLSETELLEELHESKQAIEKKLGKDCPYLCWPYGDFNNAAVKIAKDIGYKALFTINHGIVKAGSGPFVIKRMVVYTNSILSGRYIKIKKR
ncbi:MAG: polysaccharide deacetylase family protein [Thermodesulfovibrionia bacterium]|nr:polysaccharide deacetylase family protein [Thermodesulfovibrionia bacterium]